jgi:hypothetical protein
LNAQLCFSYLLFKRPSSRLDIFSSDPKILLVRWPPCDPIVLAALSQPAQSLARRSFRFSTRAKTGREFRSSTQPKVSSLRSPLISSLLSVLGSRDCFARLPMCVASSWCYRRISFPLLLTVPRLFLSSVEPDSRKTKYYSCY